MNLGKETIGSANKELAHLYLALNLNKIEQPLFSGAALSDAAFLAHLREFQAQIEPQGPQLPEKAADYIEKLAQHVEELMAYKQGLQAAEDPKVAFLEDVGVVFSADSAQASDFTLDLGQPLCVILTFRGQNTILENSFGEREVQLYPNQRGWQFPDLPLFSANPLSKNKVILLLSEFMRNKGLNSADRRAVHEKVRAHELQHTIDTIYRADELISCAYDWLVRKSLLELAATTAEGAAATEYIMGHLRAQSLFDFAPDPEQLEAEWQDQLSRIIELLTDVRKIPGFSRRLTVQMVMTSQSLTEVEAVCEFTLKNIKQA